MFPSPKPPFARALLGFVVESGKVSLFVSDTCPPRCRGAGVGYPSARLSKASSLKVDLASHVLRNKHTRLNPASFRVSNLAAISQDRSTSNKSFHQKLGGVKHIKTLGVTDFLSTLLLPVEKHSQFTTLYLGQLFKEAGFPPGVINLISGAGKVGALMASHMDIAKITFTGSGNAGRQI